MTDRVIGTLARLSASAVGTTNRVVGTVSQPSIFSGIASISGITTINGTPAQCHVLLIDNITTLLIRSTRSNSSTGFYQFNNLSRTLQFYVIAIDPNNIGNNVISNFITPGS